MMLMHTLRYKNSNIPDAADDDENEDGYSVDKKAKSKPKPKKQKQKAKKASPRAAEKDPPKSSKAPTRKQDGLSAGYKAGSFNEERMKYIRALMADEGLSWKDASASWVVSDRRAELLAGMSPSELSRRRFKLPKAKS